MGLQLDFQARKCYIDMILLSYVEQHTDHTQKWHVFIVLGFHKVKFNMLHVAPALI